MRCAKMLRTTTFAGLAAVALGCGDDEPAAAGQGATEGSSTAGVITDDDDAPDDGPDDAPDDAPGEGTVSSDDSPSSTDSASETTAASLDTTGTEDGDSSESTGDPPVIGFQGLCYQSAPDGAEAPPPPPAYTGGECPQLVPGFNDLVSMGNDRSVLVVQPSDLGDDEVLPVAVLWHWLGGSANGFLEQGDVQAAVDEFRFIALIPEEKGDLLFRWPFSVVDSDARAEEEFVFFDDMLACAAASWTIEPNCVTSVGVSAGALWTAQLASGRGEYLASAVSLSGGTGGLVKPWMGSTHKMPFFVLWGGPIDICVAINFEDTSHAMEDDLDADGHAIVECVHNCGHGVPPFGQPEGVPAFTPMWTFFLDHPYWLEDGETSWQAGIPEDLPMWCDVGPGSATPRVGECDPSQC